MKRTRLRRRKLVPRGTVTNKMLDDACRAVVFARDGYRCVRCGDRTYIQWAHVYSRRYLSLRWAIGNAMALCGGCHLWWHHNPLDAVTWWVGKYGEQAHAQLRHTLQSKGKLDRRLTLMWLQQELKKYRTVELSEVFEEAGQTVVDAALKKAFQN